MQRSFSVPITFNPNPLRNWSAEVDISPFLANWAWEIYQIAIETQPMQDGTQCEIYHNGNMLCWTPNGSKDVATGPPNVVVQPSEKLIVVFSQAATPNTVPGQTEPRAIVTISYNERQTGYALQ